MNDEIRFRLMFVAAAVAAALVMTVGLTAQSEPELEPFPCTAELAYTRMLKGELLAESSGSMYGIKPIAQRDRTGERSTEKVLKAAWRVAASAAYDCLDEAYP